VRQAIWGESWEAKATRLRAASAYGHYTSWRLCGVVVKTADDLRQEQLASRVLAEFQEIFAAANLPLWLRPYAVELISGDSGTIELIPDTIAISSLKKQYGGYKTLDEIFSFAFSDRMVEARQAFMESLAAYSLVCYFLSVKDRHNGNLMLDREGHIIHIDFGFMLSNSPGNVAFETAAFKLTGEIVDVMGGKESPEYEHFRSLVVRGFLEARKHMNRIMLLVQMVADESTLPCFSEGAESVCSSMEERFFATLPEQACIERVIEIIDSSVDNWRTIQYDNYQRITNGIL
jgi:phosphatidylinositol 4-kinase